MKIINITTILTLIGLIVLTGCSTTSEQKEIPKLCTADWTPVCGIDGKTYGNICGAGDIEIAYEGECKESHACTTEEKENKMCTREYIPVCANDGETYATGCTACSEGVDSYIEGECPKETHTCTENEKQNVACTMDYTPVCGSDGQTHSNGCSACSAKIDSWTEGECTV